jgi:hypothetical protein
VALSWDHVEVVLWEYLPLHVVLLHETVSYPRSRCLPSDGIDTSHVGLLILPSHELLEGAASEVPDMNDKTIGTLAWFRTYSQNCDYMLASRDPNRSNDRDRERSAF